MRTTRCLTNILFATAQLCITCPIGGAGDCMKLEVIYSIPCMGETLIFHLRNGVPGNSRWLAANDYKHRWQKVVNVFIEYDTFLNSFCSVRATYPFRTSFSQIFFYPHVNSQFWVWFLSCYVLEVQYHLISHDSQNQNGWHRTEFQPYMLLDYAAGLRSTAYFL